MNKMKLVVMNKALKPYLNLFKSHLYFLHIFLGLVFQFYNPREQEVDLLHVHSQKQWWIWKYTNVKCYLVPSWGNINHSVFGFSLMPMALWLAVNCCPGDSDWPLAVIDSARPGCRAKGTKIQKAYYAHLQGQLWFVWWTQKWTNVKLESQFVEQLGARTSSLPLAATIILFVH